MPKFHQAEKSPLLSGLSQEWDDMSSSDLIIKCAQGVSVLSHKMVLASLAPEMLKAVLLEHAEEKATVIAPEADAKSLRDFLQRVYQGGEEEASLPEDLLYLGIDLPYQIEDDQFDDESGEDSSQSNDEYDDAWVNKTPLDNMDEENFNLTLKEEVLEGDEDSLPINSAITKRKRGRPRKTDRDKVIVLGPKRPRGRPRKLDQENNVELDSDTCYEASLLDNNYEEKTEMELKEDTDDLNSTVDSTIIKRKRGRPRKSDADNRTIGAGPKRPRGRPRKHPIVESDEEIPDMVTKRKRGRPRKYDIDAGDVDNTRTPAPKKILLPNKYQCILDQFLRPKCSKKSYVCKKCKSGVKVRGYVEHHCCLAKHLMEEHEQVYRQVLQEANLSVEGTTEEINRIIEEEDAKDHNIYGDPSERTCKDCGRMFNCRQGMLKHWKAMHSRHNLRTCHVCGKEFSSIVQLRKHGHGYDRPFMCSFCGHRFSKKAHRDTHEKEHTGDKDHACSYCPKKFATKHRLKIHIRTHTGEKPFQCEVCSRTFATKTHLMTHSVIHTGARPHHCQYCRQSFRHLSTKHKHPCPERDRQQELKQQQRLVRTPIAPINPDIQLYQKPIDG